MTNQELEYFSQYADRFRTAVHSDYARNIRSDEMKELCSRFYALTGTKLTANTSCSRCVLQNFKIIGKWYEAQLLSIYESQTPDKSKKKKSKNGN